MSQQQPKRSYSTALAEDNPISSISTGPGPPNNPTNIRLNSVNPIWMVASDTERYLLLEDPETNDVLMPLIYMKHILEANYSRKLSSLKHRLVSIPPGGPLAKQEGLLYWQWAFESPHNIKVIVRNEIGEATPQGHLRLVLVPIVYNALVSRHECRSTPLFRALHCAMRTSTYWPLLRPLPDIVVKQLDESCGLPQEPPLPEPLFQGPRILESTALKYMFMFKNQYEVEVLKKARTTGPANGDAGKALVTEALQHGSVAQHQPTDLMDVMKTGGTRGPKGRNRQLGAGRGGGGDGVGGGELSGQDPMSAHYQQAGMGVGAGAYHSSDPAAVKQREEMANVVERKLFDVVQELGRLKACMLQLYGAVLSVTTQQATSFPPPPPPPLGLGLPPTAHIPANAPPRPSLPRMPPPTTAAAAAPAGMAFLQPAPAPTPTTITALPHIPNPAMTVDGAAAPVPGGAAATATAAIATATNTATLPLPPSQQSQQDLAPILQGLQNSLMGGGSENSFDGLVAALQAGVGASQEIVGIGGGSDGGIGGGIEALTKSLLGLASQSQQQGALSLPLLSERGVPLLMPSISSPQNINANATNQHQHQADPNVPTTTTMTTMTTAKHTPPPPPAAGDAVEIAKNEENSPVPVSVPVLASVPEEGGHPGASEEEREDEDEGMAAAAAMGVIAAAMAGGGFPSS